MRKCSKIILSSALAVSLVSCVKDEYDAEDCGREVRIELQWHGSTLQADPDVVRIRAVAADGTAYNYTSDQYGIDVDLLPGTYRLYGREDAENITIDGNRLTVRTNTDGTASVPSAFSAGFGEGTVYNRTGLQVLPLPMYRQTRELIIRVYFSGDGLHLIEGLQGNLSGIAISRDIADCFPPLDGEVRPPAITSGNIGYTFDGIATDYFSGSSRLIGIDGDGTQTLAMRLMLETETYKDMDVDVTDRMDGFHTEEVAEPWVIKFTINVGVDLDLSIVDWNSGPESNLVAS